MLPITTTHANPQQLPLALSVLSASKNEWPGADTSACSPWTSAPHSRRRGPCRWAGNRPPGREPWGTCRSTASACWTCPRPRCWVTPGSPSYPHGLAGRGHQAGRRSVWSGECYAGKRSARNNALRLQSTISYTTFCLATFSGHW